MDVAAFVISNSQGQTLTTGDTGNSFSLPTASGSARTPSNTSSEDRTVRRSNDPAQSIAQGTASAYGPFSGADDPASASEEMATRTYSHGSRSLEKEVPPSHHHPSITVHKPRPDPSRVEDFPQTLVKYKSIDGKDMTILPESSSAGKRRRRPETYNSTAEQLDEEGQNRCRVWISHFAEKGEQARHPDLYELRDLATNCDASMDQISSFFLATFPRVRIGQTPTTSIERPRIREQSSLDDRIHAYLEQAAQRDCVEGKASVHGPGPLLCPKRCGSSFKNTPEGREVWIKHIKRFDPMELFACPFCDNIEIRGSRLESHAQQYHGDMPIPKTKDAWKRFKKAHKIEQQQIPFSKECGVCSESFTNWNQYYRDHWFVHLLEPERTSSSSESESESSQDNEDQSSSPPSSNGGDDDDNHGNRNDRGNNDDDALGERGSSSNDPSLSRSRATNAAQRRLSSKDSDRPPSKRARRTNHRSACATLQDFLQLQRKAQLDQITTRTSGIGLSDHSKGTGLAIGSDLSHGKRMQSQDKELKHIGEHLGTSGTIVNSKPERSHIDPKRHAADRDEQLLQCVIL